MLRDIRVHYKSEQVFVSVLIYAYLWLCNYRSECLNTQAGETSSITGIQSVAARCVQVPAQLKEAFMQAVAAGRIRSMQNKSMPAAPLHRPGALLLGVLRY